MFDDSSTPSSLFAMDSEPSTDDSVKVEFLVLERVLVSSFGTTFADERLSDTT
eukprot:CAMPEP_0195266944 /NCGR_PEP_ID=MMETSP0706-20130129/12305_1 /TAXON_ID=33640 /ORGANISM="Asterionellopsis glacialis, Strain CCMP134" /LENGTH=52 /DNA_ID=CAMNT_0040321619 /DNA_START=375 /DNA_END=529 /DNA_ORIENTATION=-